MIRFYLYIYFSSIKVSTGYYQKTRKGFKKRLAKSIKIFLKKRKTKSANMLVKSIKIFPRKKKTKSENIVTNAIKIFLKIKNS